MYCLANSLAVTRLNCKPLGDHSDRRFSCPQIFDKALLDCDHFQLNKFSGPLDGRYVAVCGEIKEIAMKGPRIVKERQDSKWTPSATFSKS